MAAAAPATIKFTAANALTGIAVLGIAYLIYFDQRRQRDPAFRRTLRENRKKAAEAREQDAKKAAEGADASVKAVMSALGLDEDIVPTTEEERQRYLQKQLQLGEELLKRGPTYYKAASTCLYRAVKVYPDPFKLLMAFQDTVPTQVFEDIMAMMATDADGGRQARPAGTAAAVELD
ncbi:MAS20 protein import receptor-domain-containing protein [Zopfochytrium polystomum]|nr:MAS20 protein import receptor-domain-containing protein [Zopfochytrium polystomum]